MTSTSYPIQDYALLSDEECDAKIIAAKAKLGKRCVILGHHYQRDEVFKHADCAKALSICLDGRVDVAVARQQLGKRLVQRRADESL